MLRVFVQQYFKTAFVIFILNSDWAIEVFGILVF